MHHPPQNDVVDLTDYIYDTDDQLQQAIAASLLDVCCPNADAEISVDLQAQQMKEFEYYQQRQLTSGRAPDSTCTSVPKAESQLDSHMKIDCQENMGFAKELQRREQGETPHEKEEGSQASTTSAEPSLSAQETSGHTPDNATLSSMETPKAAEARLPAMGLVNPGLQCQSRVATWPTAAAQLMGAPKLQVKSARPASPVSSGSTGSFSNKRRKLDPSHTLLGMTQCTTAWQTNQPAVHSDHVPTRQLERPASHNNNPGVASDADSDPHDPGAAPQHRNAATSLTQAVLSSCHFTDKHIFTAAPDLLASTEHLRSDLVDVECGSEFSNQSPVDDGTSSDASVPVCPTDDRYKQAKGKRCIGPSPLPWYDPQQESKLDHIRMGNWVWWRIDSTWTFARVEARYCNFFGLVHEYRISVLDELNGDFPVDGVPPDQIYMHFFPGSRVNIEWRKAQVKQTALYMLYGGHHVIPVVQKGLSPSITTQRTGEVLPIQYRQLFNGFYTVKLDEGAEEQVAHSDLSLLYNNAEASSWVRCAQTSLSDPHSDRVAGPQGSALQQQQQQDDVSATHLGQVDVSLKSPDVPLCTPTTTAAVFAAHTRETGIANMTRDITAAAVRSSSQEEAEEQVVPQLRRTKRTVAQKRLASSVSQAMGVSFSAGRSVQRKLSHTQQFQASDRLTAIAKERKSSADVFPVSSATMNGVGGPTIEQMGRDRQVTAREHDSDDDLFVDLSRANIKSRLSGLQTPQPFVTPVKSLTSLGGGVLAPAGVAASPTHALSRGGSAGRPASPQSGRKSINGNPGAKLTNNDAFAVLGLNL